MPKEFTSTESFSTEVVGLSALRGACLTVLWSPDPAAHQLTIFLKEPLAVGRAPGEGGLALADRKLSRLHFTVRSLGDHFEIVDLASKNGTFVNGLQIRSAPLRPGAIIRAGKTLLLFATEVRTPRHLRRADPWMTGRAEELLEALADARIAIRERRSFCIQGPAGSGRWSLAHRIARDALSEEVATITAETSPDDLPDARVYLLDDPVTFSRALQEALLARKPRPTLIGVCAEAPRRDQIVMGLFRQLVSTVTLPPLWERRGDILDIAQDMQPDLELDANLAEVLTLYPWPGGLQELEDRVARSEVIADPELAAFISGLREGLRGVRPSDPRLDPETPWLERLARFGDPEGDALIIDSVDERLRPPGEDLIELEGRNVIQRMASTLIEQRLRAPAEPISSEDLIESVWPGERILQHAALNRLYKTLSLLRKYGLRDLIVNVDGGYHLDPETPLLDAIPPSA